MHSPAARAGKSTNGRTPRSGSVRDLLRNLVEGWNTKLDANGSTVYKSSVGRTEQNGRTCSKIKSRLSRNRKRQTKGRSRLGRPSSPKGKALVEGLDRSGFVVPHVKDGVQLGDLEQVVNFLGQVQQFEFAALVAHRGKGADQLANA